MKKAHIILISALVLAAVVLGIVYYIFFKERLDKYREDHAMLKELVEKTVELDELFKGTKPEAFLEASKEIKPVWDEAIAQRAAVFDLNKTLEVEPIPEGKWPKFWYEEEFHKRMLALQQAAFEKRVAVPNTTFGAPYPDQLTDTDVTKEQATQWLQLLQLGTAGIRLLLDANVLHIEQAVLYPVRKEYGVLDSYSYGFVFYIYLDDLAKLLKSLSEKDDSYHNVQGIRVSNGMLRSYDDPPLLVEMILARATYDPEAQVAPKRAVDETGQEDVWVRLAGLEDEDEDEDYMRDRTVYKQPWYLRIWSIVGL